MVSDKQRRSIFVRRDDFFLRLYCAGDPTPTQLVGDTNKTVFRRILANKHGVLTQLFPDHIDQPYSLKPRRHNRLLSVDEIGERYGEIQLPPELCHGCGTLPPNLNPNPLSKTSGGKVFR